MIYLFFTLTHIRFQSPLFLGKEGKRTLFRSVAQNRLPVTNIRLQTLPPNCGSSPPRILVHSINAVGVDIAPLSAIADEEEVVLLPGLPLINRAGENPDPDLWTFEVETPFASCATTTEDSVSATIDYVHPGVYLSF